MKTQEIITGLRKLSQQGSQYRRTVCRLAAGLLESQQRRITELKKELRSAVYDLGVASECWSCKHDSKCHSDMPIAMPDACCGSYKWRGATDTNVGGKWIAVTERLPEVVDSYLVVVKAKYDHEDEYEIGVDVATYNPHEKAYIDDCWNTYIDWDEGQQYLHVTHWMPLPEPPKEDAI